MRALDLRPIIGTYVLTARGVSQLLARRRCLRLDIKQGAMSTRPSFQRRRRAKVHPPSVVIGIGNNTTEAEDCLALNISFPSRGEYCAVRDHQVFGDLWVGYYDEQLAAYPD